MPRKPRYYVPGVPAHVIQRGNNRGACFLCREKEKESESSFTKTQTAEPMSQ